jgi:hypothetical protein
MTGGIRFPAPFTTRDRSPGPFALNKKMGRGDVDRPPPIPRDRLHPVSLVSAKSAKIFKGDRDNRRGRQ